MQKKLIGFLTKNGNKTAALIIFNKICNKISAIIPIISLSYFFSLFFLKLNTNIEIRKVSFRRRIHFIPIPIKTSRKIFIIFKWIKQVISNNKQNISFYSKLYNELLAVVFLETSSSIMKLKLENELKAYQYKSKAHFRWN
jgi:ribosomal protein S7